MNVRKYEKKDIPALMRICNEVVEAGQAYPQEELLTEQTAEEFFAAQSFTAAAEDNGEAVGLYILHPNNVGRCGHIANASYAVRSDMRGKHVGRELVSDCLHRCKELGFRVLQFNAVVADNIPALVLYKSLGFAQLGVIPGGFRIVERKYVEFPVRLSSC